MNDARLPQLETVLDPGAMLGVLATECLSPGFEARSCRVSHVRYKPGRNCLIRYDLTIAGARGAETEQILCGRAYSPGESEPRWLKALEAPMVDVPAGRPVVHIPRLSMVVWSFPNERKLRGLELLLDPQWLRETALPAILGASVADVSSEMVRYIPEHGCTVRVRAELTDGSCIVLFGKIHAGSEGERTYEWSRALGRRVWHQPEHRILWQQAIPGRSATLTDPLESCARALAALHAAPLELFPAEPGPEGGETPLLTEIARRLPPPSTVATLHGDLHLKNFLIEGDRAELIDLDTLRAGDPHEDLGSFAASLYHRALLGEASVEAVEAAIALFVKAYRENVSWTVDDDTVALQTARALIVERARRAVTRRKGDVVEQLLAIAERLVAGTQSPLGLLHEHRAWVASRPGSVLDVHYRTWKRAWRGSYATVAWRDANGIVVERSDQGLQWRFPHDAAVPWMAEAADPEAVRKHLPIAADRVEVEVLNYRPGNRVTARYRIETGQGERVIYGKCYSDDRGIRVHERFLALAERGFPMPAALGYSAAIRTVWQEAFPGRPFDCASDGSLIAGAAARLRFLHESGIDCPARMTVAAQYADMAKKMAKLASVLPMHEMRLRTLVSKLASMMARLESIPVSVVHGDFHARQLMVSGTGVALFDFDEIAAGDPVEDFGHFIADLHGESSSDARRLGMALIAAYESQARWRVPSGRLAWHTAVQLLTRAYRCLLQLKPDFEDRVERHIRLAEESL